MLSEALAVGSKARLKSALRRNTDLGDVAHDRGAVLEIGAIQGEQIMLCPYGQDDPFDCFWVTSEDVEAINTKAR